MINISILYICFIMFIITVCLLDDTLVCVIEYHLFYLLYNTSILLYMCIIL
nr:MAG TPA: hypothetical protein [Bacteriophage sp.]